MESYMNRIKTLNPRRIALNMLVGAAIGLVLISLLVFGVDDPDPSWGRAWRVRPLIITPLAAAFGMLAFFLRDIVRPDNGAQRILVFLLSLAGFIVALWLGVVLGLDGTLWN
jgi:hypothetical protein